MTAAPIKNFTFLEGEEDTISITVNGPDGSALDLTGLAVKYRAVGPDGSTVLDLEDGTGVTVTDAAGGKLEISFAAADTTQTPGAYKHELRLEGVGYKETVFVGELRIEASIFV